MERAERFHPYGTRENAVPGSPTLVVNQPTGGKPETSVDAEETNNFTEKNKSAVSSIYRSRPLHVIERSFDVRSRSGLQTAKGLPARVAPNSSEMGPSSLPGPKGGRVCETPRASTQRLPVSEHRNLDETTRLTQSQPLLRLSPRSDRWCINIPICSNQRRRKPNRFPSTRGLSGIGGRMRPPCMGSSASTTCGKMGAGRVRSC